MIVFSGIDIVIDVRLRPDQIRDAVASAVSVPARRVAVIYDLAKYPARESADVVCVVSGAAGHFVELISLQCEPMTLPFLHALDVVARFCSTVRVKALAPDDGPDPYLMWLVEPDRPPSQVAVDPAALDDHRYVIRHLPQTSCRAVS